MKTSHENSPDKKEKKSNYNLKEWRCKPGSMDSLYLKSTNLEELPKIQNDQVLVETKALGLNFADVFSVLGKPKKLLNSSQDFTKVNSFEFQPNSCTKGRIHTWLGIQWSGLKFIQRI
jgi:hypothetical protein